MGWAAAEGWANGAGHDVRMTEPVVSHVLLDFFGTLVGYSPSRTEQGYHLFGSFAATRTRPRPVRLSRPTSANGTPELSIRWASWNW